MQKKQDERERSRERERRTRGKRKYGQAKLKHAKRGIASCGMILHNKLLSKTMCLCFFVQKMVFFAKILGF